MDIRSIRQDEAVASWKPNGILNCCPRFGKIKCALEICKENNFKRILLCFPRLDIFESWRNDIKVWGFEGKLEIETSTFTSLHKKQGKWDLVIFDEIHEASDAQLVQIERLGEDNKTLGLSGTMTYKTEENIAGMTGMYVCYKYAISQGVAEGILPDYRITVHVIPLDDKKIVKVTKKGKKYTERGWFNTMMFLSRKGKIRMFELKMIQIIQSSISKLKKTKDLLLEFKGRVLVFCGQIKIADSLGIPSYHSKSKEHQIFEDFCSGVEDRLATIKMMRAGITIIPIERGIINYTSGNPEDCAQIICRFLTFEYDNPEKVAKIHIISSNESFELNRIKTALMFFEPDKIIYIYENDSSR